MFDFLNSFRESHSIKVNTAAKPDSIFRDLLIVPDDSEEWRIMWDKLSRHRLNRGLDDPCSSEYCGEVWQYMNSEKRLFGYVHLFRHRLHPKSRCPVHIKISASRFLEIVPNQ